MKYCCQECNFSDQDLQVFTDHATENHEKRVTINVEELFQNCEKIKGPWKVKNVSVFLKYCCPECNFADQDLQIFTDHATSTHKDASVLFLPENIVEESNEVKETKQRVLCEICFILKPSSIKEMRLHRRKIHMKENQLYCFHCEKTFKGWKYLLCHIDAKHPEHAEKKFSCDECLKSFIFEKSYEQHKHYHKHAKHSSGKLLSCKICDYSNMSQYELNMHNFYNHYSGIAKKCPHCDYKIPHTHKLNRHIESNHSDQYPEKNHVCEKCGKSFIFEGSLTNHVNDSCTNHVCKKCGRSFVFKSSLTKHLKSSCKHPVQNTSHKQELTKQLLQRHIQMKHEKAEFACDKCNKSFPTKPLLASHKQIDHENCKDF